MGENLTKATLLTFSLTKLDGVQTEILYHVLTRARGAADTVSHAWNLHHWACNERYSGSESDCSAAGQIFTPRSLCLPRVSTVCCWWGLRQHIVTAAPSELISPATPQSRAKSSLSPVTCSTVITLPYSYSMCMVTLYITVPLHLCKYCEIPVSYYHGILM